MFQSQVVFAYQNVGRVDSGGDSGNTQPGRKVSGQILEAVDGHVNGSIKEMIFDFPGKKGIVRDFWEGGVRDFVTGGLDKIAVRIPDNKIALKLLSCFGPLTATSANIHGGKALETIDEINNHFKDDVAVYLDDGCLKGKPSTIVDATSDKLKILREGTISKDKIMDMM